MMALDYWYAEYKHRSEVVAYVQEVQHVISQGRYISLTPIAMPIGEDVVQIGKAGEEKKKEREKVLEVYFDFDRWNVRKDQREKLKVLEPGSYFLVGYADWIGKEGYNYRLSLKRAEETKRVMEGLGLKVVEVKGEGESGCEIRRDEKRITKGLIKELQPCRKVEIFKEVE